MEKAISEALNAERVTAIGTGGGCISSGIAYRTIEGREVYVKVNKKPEALRMFAGEEASLKALSDTNTIGCPRPIKVLDKIPGGGSALILSYLNLSSKEDIVALGEGLARLHLHNLTQIESGSDKAITKFGFHVQTCCGYLPQKNEWREDWVEFFCEKIDHQISMLGSSESEAISLWDRLRPKVREMFDGVTVRPSLLHGDLWSGNSGQTIDGPVIYDPASFYGHHEYDLGIAAIFGNYSAGSTFAKSYHRLIPKQAGFDRRHQLYQLFHYLNHWNHFGSGYRGSSIAIMKRLL